MSLDVKNQIVDKLEIGYIVIKRESSNHIIDDINQQASLILNKKRDYFTNQPLKVIQECEPKIYQYIKTEIDYPSQSIKEYKIREDYKLYFLRIFWQEDKLIVTIRDVSRQLESISSHEMLLTVMNDIVVVLNEDFIIKQLILNDEKYNIDKSAILNNSIYKLFERVDVLKIEKYFENAKRLSEVVSFNYPLKINNKLIWFDINIKYIEQLDNNLYVIKMSDITPQYTNDRKLINRDKRYQKIISLSNIGVWKYHSESGYFWCNKEYFSMLGYSKDEYIEQEEFDIKSCWVDLLHPDDKSLAVEKFNKYIEDEKENAFEGSFRLRKSDGSYAWIWSKSNKLVDDRGLNSDIYIGTHLDVTKQKEAETLAKATKEQIRVLIDQMNQGYALHEMITDENGKSIDFVYLDMNDIFENMAYHSRNQLIGKKASEVNPSRYEKMIEEYSEVAFSNKVKKREYYSTKTERYFRDIIFSPKRGQFAIVCEDVTEDKLIEIELRQNEQRFKSLLAEVDSIGVQGCDENGIVTYWNKASEKIYGYSEEEALGKSLFDLIIPEEFAESIRNDIKELFNGDKKVLTKELTLMRKDRSVVNVLTNHTIIEIHNKGKELFSFDVDLTERKEMEELLHLEKEHFKTTLLSVGDGVIATDRNGKITLINRVAEELTGWEESLAINKNLFEVFNIIDQETK
ncbi:MAG: PAS domain-containing protein, partial [Halanaerobiales bacterium]